MHICWPKIIFLLVVAGLGTVALLQGCGQKGPLYLPEPASGSGESKSKEQNSGWHSTPVVRRFLNY